MRRRAGGCLVLLAAAVAALAAPAAPAAADEPAPVDIDGRRSYDLLRHAQYLEDPSGNLTIDDVRAADGWAPSERADPNYGFTYSAYWVRLRLRNASGSRHYLVASAKYALLDYFDAYIQRRDGSFRHEKLGDRGLYEHRALPSTHLAVEVEVENGDELELYVRVETDSSMQIGLNLQSNAGFIKTETTFHVLAGLYYGIMFGLALYNVFLNISIRSRSYLYYVAFVVVFGVCQSALDGTANRYLFTDWPSVANALTPLTVAGTQIPAVLFAQHFLDTRKNAPLLHHVLTLFSALAAVGVGLSLFASYGLAIRFAAALALVFSVVTTGVGFRVWLRGYQPARFYVLAWTALFLGSIAYILVSFGVLPANNFTVNLQRIGSALEVTLLSFALADRINLLERDRQQARTEALELQHDMELTGAVQQLFLPRVAEQSQAPLSLAGFQRSAARCGGDWWWHETLDDGRLLIIVGDVSGHGAVAAIMTGVVASTYRNLRAEHGEPDPDVLFQSVHQRFKEMTGGSNHLCLIALTVDPVRRELSVWTGGAPPVYVMDRDGDVQPVLARGGLLGVDELRVGVERKDIEPGVRIFAFSDGLPELVKENGRQLGYKGVLRMLAATRNMSLGAARADLLAQIERARGAEAQRDDITFVLVDFEPSGN